MSIDYDKLPLPKGTPKAVAKDARDRARKSLDERENAKVKARSGGRCEIVTDGRVCHRRGTQVHHMLGGRGIRGRGESAKASRKQHACERCHAAITSHRIQRRGPALPHYLDSYRKAEGRQGQEP